MDRRGTRERREDKCLALKMWRVALPYLGFTTVSAILYACIFVVRFYDHAMDVQAAVPVLQQEMAQTKDDIAEIKGTERAVKEELDLVAQLLRARNNR